MALRADRALVLTGQAQLDLAGRPVPFEELTKYSWGGEAILESRHGDITQAAGSVIDLSARYNRAGRLTAIALDPGAGRVDLQGRILGSASGDYETGGSRVPYAQGAVDIRAQQLDFTALNQRLNAGSVYGARSFQIKRGDLTIGDEVRAREVNISVDAGSLTVAGRIDASGVSVGSIRLSARDGLRLASNAVLDAHGTTLRVDSYGQIIDAPNRAIVELKAGQGTLRLDGGARIDLRAGSDDPRQDGKPRGTLELNAPRLNGARGGDIDIEARGPLDIRGARSIAVNGVWVDRSATPAPKPLPPASPIRSSTRTTWTACTTTAAPSSPRRWPTPAWSTASWPACAPMPTRCTCAPASRSAAPRPTATWWCRATWTCPATATPASTRTPR